ncbi:MAG: sulfurtransferase complex subunit TusB [Thalassotalea sp.]
MTTLHLIRDNTLINNSVHLALTNIAPDDIVVLIDDGCYNVEQVLMSSIQAVLPITQCYAIKSHLCARALPTDNITLINYEQLVDLIFIHNNVITWQ